MELALLFLLTLLLGVALYALWRQGRQLEKVSERLDDFSALAFLPDRVQALTRAVEEAELDGLHDRLDRLGEALSRVEDLTAAPAEGAAEAGSRPQALRARILRFLRDEGCLSVRILSDDADLQSESAEVRVQAIRNGSLVRGRVVVEGDEIVEIRLDPQYAAFP